MKIGLYKLLQIRGWYRNILVLTKFGVTFAGQSLQIIFPDLLNFQYLQKLLSFGPCILGRSLENVLASYKIDFVEDLKIKFFEI